MDERLQHGLAETEAASRLTAVGPNELPRGRGRGLLRIVFETIREPMFLLLVGAAGLYLVLGDLAEGLFLVVGAVASIGLVVMQELEDKTGDAEAARREIGREFAEQSLEAEHELLDDFDRRG